MPLLQVKPFVADAKWEIAGWSKSKHDLEQNLKWAGGPNAISVASVSLSDTRVFKLSRGGVSDSGHLDDTWWIHLELEDKMASP